MYQSHVHSEALFDNCILIGSTCQVNYATFKNCTIFTQVQHHGITSTLMINSIFQPLPIRSKNPYALGFDPDQVGPWTNRKVLLEGIASQYPGDPNARDGIVSAPNASNIGAASGAGYYQNFDIFVPFPTFRNIDDPIGPDQLWFSNDDGLQLSDDASAINSGSTPHLFNTYEQYTTFVNSGNAGLTDILGRNRVNGNSVDIGAYEYYFVPQYNVSEANSSAGTINGGRAVLC